MGLSQGNAGHSQQPLSFFCLQQLKGWHHDLSLHPPFLHPAHVGFSLHTQHASPQRAD
jgi:hypothetical protein